MAQWHTDTDRAVAAPGATERWTYCQFCNAQCGMVAHVDQGRVVGVAGDLTDPGSRGELCIKGQQAPALLYAPDRLRYPRMRVGGRREAAWHRATWSESIAFIADRLERVRTRYGPEALALYMGSTNQTIDTVMVRRFARVFGTPNVTRTWSVCVGPKASRTATFGTPAPRGAIFGTPDTSCYGAPIPRSHTSTATMASRRTSWPRSGTARSWSSSIPAAPSWRGRPIAIFRSGRPPILPWP